MLVSTALIKFSSVLILPEPRPLESPISSMLRENKKQYEILLTLLYGLKKITRENQESRREGWTDEAIMLCKLNKSL